MPLKMIKKPFACTGTSPSPFRSVCPELRSPANLNNEQKYGKYNDKCFPESVLHLPNKITEISNKFITKMETICSKSVLTVTKEHFKEFRRKLGCFINKRNINLLTKQDNLPVEVADAGVDLDGLEDVGLQALAQLRHLRVEAEFEVTEGPGKEEDVLGDLTIEFGKTALTDFGSTGPDDRAHDLHGLAEPGPPRVVDEVRVVLQRPVVHKPFVGLQQQEAAKLEGQQDQRDREDPAIVDVDLLLDDDRRRGIEELREVNWPLNSVALLRIENGLDRRVRGLPDQLHHGLRGRGLGPESRRRERQWRSRLRDPRGRGRGLN